MKILIAEDMELLQSLYRTLMASWGHDCDVAADGITAIELLREHGRYHLCIMDIHMPKMDGLSAARIIRQESGDLPILGHSNDDGMREACLKAGMNGFLPKSAKPDALRAAIEELAGAFPVGGKPT